MKRVRRRVTIEGLYYAHGLLCASYPISMLSFVFMVVVVCSLPFFVTPSGDLNTPKPWRSPWLNYRVPAGKGGGALREGMEWIVDNSTQFSGRVPSWFRGLPVALAQQLYVTVQVNCSSHSNFCQKSYLSSTKAASASLLHSLSNKTRSCYSVLHPAAVRLTSELDPAHPPGVFSPLLDTILTHWESDQQVLGFQTTKELLYGGLWQKEHSFAPSPPSSPSSPSPPSPPSSHPLTKTHMFSITLLLDASVLRFSSLTRCVEAIRGVWPAKGVATPPDARAHFIRHFYYEPDWNLVEFLPLLSVYFIVFLYISFSVGKIDLVKSKVGLGVSAIVTLVCSLTMSLGICTFFGLSISLSSSEVYPFFVIVLGLENILIIVKAVMSTPEEFEVKQRIAAGLSKEGRAITRNLSTLLLMLSMGIIFFNYTMKEFCIVGLVALLCDAFLQLFFFPTVLSIDLRRLELSDLGSDPVSVAMQQASEGAPSTMTTQGPCPPSLHITPPSRWRSKRVKFAYFLASARLVSRAIMVAIVVSMMVVWAAKTDKIQKLLGFNFFLPPPTSLPLDPPSPPSPSTPSQRGEGEGPSPLDQVFPYHSEASEALSEPTSKAFSKWDKASNDAAELLKMGVAVWSGGSDGWSVMCEAGEVCWRAMVTTHWPKLLQHYGYPIKNRFLTVLPPVMLTFDLGTSSAHSPLDSTHKDHTQVYHMAAYLISHPYFVKGSVMCVFVCVVLVYCVWLVRSTLRRLDVGHTQGEEGRGEGGGKLRNIFLKGHTQDIECLCVSDSHLVSASLDGDIRVWNTDAMTQGCALTISRSEQCGDLLTYADKWRPDADGCEASVDNKSIRSFQMVPAPLSPSPASSGGTPPVNFTLGGPPAHTMSSPVPSGHVQRVTTSHVHGPPPTVTHQITSSVTNQVAVSAVPHSPIVRSTSVQSMGEMRQPFHTHPLPHPPPQTSSGPPLPPSSPPSSPPPSPRLPYYTTRRHSTQSLQECVLRSQLEKTAPGETMPLPLCGLPTTPPESAPVISSHNKPRPQSAQISDVGQYTISSDPTLQSTVPFQSVPQTHQQHVTTALSHTSHRGHTRSKSLGVFPALPSRQSHVPPIPTRPRTRRRGHSRNSSVGGASQPVGGVRGHDFTTAPELTKSSVSLSSKFPTTSKAPPPNPEKGYDFAKHFNLFSPYTSNMALEFGQIGEEGLGVEVQETPPPAVWSMDVWNNSIAVGCGNGQIELWNMTRGSLIFALSTNLAGATVIAITPQGIISGHMDGCLHIVGLDGHQRHTLPTHTRPVSVLRSGGGRVVSGGYDGVVVVHRLGDLERETAITIHSGNNVTSIALDSTAAMCVSGCRGGVVCYWELATGNCRHMLQETGGGAEGLMEGVAVIKVDISVGGAVVGLMSDETVVVWDKASGENLYTIALEGMCQDYALLGDRYMAACVESTVVVYDLDSGQKRFAMAVEGGERGVVVIRHLLPLQGTHVVCSTGRDIQIVHCNVKLKVD